MAICQVAVNPNAKQYVVLPVSGAGSNIPVGTLMRAGATQGTNEGVAIPYASGSPATSGTALGIGILQELHNFAVSGDATQTTLVQWFQVGAMLGASYAPGASVNAGNPFPSRKIELFDNSILFRIDYAVGAVAVASYSAPTITITSEVAGFGGGFVYVNGGTGIGQLGFIASSTAGSMALVTGKTFTTPLDSTSTLTKILPHFYSTPIWKVNTTTAPTLLDSVAGAGSGRGACLGSYIQRNNMEDRLDPLIFNNMQSLSGLAVLNFYSLMQAQSTVFHPIA
jgi:hypothetical protein